MGREEEKSSERSLQHENGANMEKNSSSEHRGETAMATAEKRASFRYISTDREHGKEEQSQKTELEQVTVSV